MVDFINAKPRSGHPEERQWFNALEDDVAGVRSTLPDTLREHREQIGCFFAARLTMFWCSYFRAGRRWPALARLGSPWPGNGADLDHASATSARQLNADWRSGLTSPPFIEEGLRGER